MSSITFQFFSFYLSFRHTKKNVLFFVTGLIGTKRANTQNRINMKASFWGLFKTNFCGHFHKLFLFTKFNFSKFQDKVSG